jgi:kanamycin kinase
VRAEVGIPEPVLALAGGEAVRPVWVNELGGITFEIGAEDRRRFVKWAPAGSGLDLAAEAALDRLADAPPADKLVVCHGDSCAPNTLLTGDGRCSGHVDLGELGVADRWADLAVATWSTTWNYGPGWETALLDAYGIAPDPDRTRTGPATTACSGTWARDASGASAQTKADRPVMARPTTRVLISRVPS